MKTTVLIAAVALAAAGLIAAAPAVPTATITGDYVEARSASVFAGACHYNGELVTDGREAIMAWNVASGSWNGVDLGGVRAAAMVAADANLADEHATRKSELVIDSAATAAQAAAFANAVQTRFHTTLGDILSVRRAAITFTHTSAGYTVQADHFIALSIQPMPNAECCKQPNLIWYQPLVPLSNRKVGYTTNAAYTAGTHGDAWQRSGENSAFYGNFSF
jgi:hypothetical protein